MGVPGWGVEDGDASEGGNETCFCFHFTHLTLGERFYFPTAPSMYSKCCLATRLGETGLTDHRLEFPKLWAKPKY